MELLDLLVEQTRGQVPWMILSKVKHSFLAGIFGTLDVEGVHWLGAVLEEELRLELILGEVFNQYSGGDLASQILYQCLGDYLVILSL
jgi:hypothetical protein